MSCQNAVILESSVTNRFSVLNATKVAYKLNSGRLLTENKKQIRRINIKHVNEQLSDINLLQATENKTVCAAAEYLVNELQQ